MTVYIVVRSKRNGKRSWETSRPLAAGESYYLCWREAGRRRYKQAGVTTRAAEAAQRLQERILAGEIQPPEPMNMSRPCKAALRKYLDYLRTAKKQRDGRPYTAKSIQEREADIKEFIESLTLSYIDQVRRQDFISWRAKRPELASATWRSKFSSVTGWLKFYGIEKLLKSTDWPPKSRPNPKPYTSAEIDDMLGVAEGREHLLLRFALATGMRLQEIIYAETSDIVGNCIVVKDKASKFGWYTKNTAAHRNITLDPALRKELLVLPKGLLFPNGSGTPDTHLYEIFERVGRAAGVTKPSANAGWSHRWRHSCGTELVRAKDLSLVEIMQTMGWTDPEMIRIYAAADPESPASVKAAKKRARPGKKRAT
jgi:integrase